MLPPKQRRRSVAAFYPPPAMPRRRARRPTPKVSLLEVGLVSDSLVFTGSFDNADEVSYFVQYTGQFFDDGAPENLTGDTVHFFGQFWPASDLADGRYRR